MASPRLTAADIGDIGNVANIGSAGGTASTLLLMGGGLPRPIGASPWPVIRKGQPLQWRGQLNVTPAGLPDELWKLVDKTGAPLPDIQRFRGWVIEFLAVAAVAQLAAHPATKGWSAKGRCQPDDWPRHNAAMVSAELDMLMELKAYREGVMEEAIAQATAIIPYFQGLVGCTDQSHPQASDLCIIAQQLGQFVVMLYKQKFNRPRPSQLRPALLPEFAVPGYAAYPSGHATQSHLIAYVLERVIGDKHPARELLHPLADRIALNREVIGLHYRSDSEAGKKLAEQINKEIDRVIEHDNNTKTLSIVNATISDAIKEWSEASSDSSNIE